jgi:hypothetical protein
VGAFFVEPGLTCVVLLLKKFAKQFPPEGKMERKIDPREQLRTIEPLLEKYEGLSERHFDAEMVKAELDKLSKEELVELQVRMFAQYHEMARAVVEMAEALKVALQSQDLKPE